MTKTRAVMLTAATLLTAGCQSHARYAHQGARGPKPATQAHVRIAADGPGLVEVDWARLRVAEGSSCELAGPAECELGVECRVDVTISGGECVLEVREYSRTRRLVRAYCHDLSGGDDKTHSDGSAWDTCIDQSRAAASPERSNS